jgi:hypothetical protein
MEQLFRHGDLVLRKLDKADGALTPTVDLVLAGRDTAPHTLIGPCRFRTTGEGAATVTTVELDAPTVISHMGRHTDGELPAGVYRIAALVEGEGRSAIED